jgi:hypothetical protein
MLARWEGLTSTYNRFYNPEEGAQDIVRLRELHVKMDIRRRQHTGEMMKEE